MSCSSNNYPKGVGDLLNSIKNYSIVVGKKMKRRDWKSTTLSFLIIFSHLVNLSKRKGPLFYEIIMK